MSKSATEGAKVLILVIITMFSVHSDPDSLNITSSVDITNQSRASYSLESLGLHHQDALFSSVDDGNISVGDLLAKLSANTSQFTSLADLIRVLREAKIYGPVGLLDDNEEIAMSGGHHLRKFLGLGSQFIVYRQQMEVVTGQMVSSRVVAVKQPKFRLDAQQRLNLTDAKVREQLHDMYLEVLAFSNPTLRSHPNIARLLAWSVDPRSWHTPPLLIMEVAFSDLKTFLQGEGPDALWELKYFICLDVASALDVIHEFRLVHGDLKPRNVLIYPTHSRFIAKLADFGLSVDEALFLRTDTCVAGTPGWQAPEVESHQCIQLDDLPYVDSYSYGLLVWSVFCHTGNCPPQSGAVDRQDTARKELGVLQDALDPAKRLNLDLPRVIGSLLEYKACNRPTQMVKILDDGSEIPNEWHMSVKELVLFLDYCYPESLGFIKIFTPLRTCINLDTILKRITSPGNHQQYLPSLLKPCIFGLQRIWRAWLGISCLICSLASLSRH